MQHGKVSKICLALVAMGMLVITACRGEDFPLTLANTAAGAREEAMRQARAGNFDGAREALYSMSLRLSEAGPEYGAVVAEHALDLKKLGKLMEQEELREMDVKYAAQRAYNVRRGKQSYEEKLRRKD